MASGELSLYVRDVRVTEHKPKNNRNNVRLLNAQGVRSYMSCFANLVRGRGGSNPTPSTGIDHSPVELFVRTLNLWSTSVRPPLPDSRLVEGSEETLAYSERNLVSSWFSLMFFKILNYGRPNIALNVRLARSVFWSLVWCDVAEGEAEA